jgi:hypothetical protein
MSVRDGARKALRQWLQAVRIVRRGAHLLYLAFDAVPNIALPCAVDSAAINLLNRCMPATRNDS